MYAWIVGWTVCLYFTCEPVCPPTGASGGVVTGLGRGDHSVEVEAALECNPQIKTTRTMSFTSPNSIVPPAIQVASKDNVKVFSFDVCETADYQCQVDSAERTTCELLVCDVCICVLVSFISHPFHVRFRFVAVHCLRLLPDSW